MPQPQQVFPDIEGAAVVLLTGLLPGIHVCLELPPVDEFNALLPVVQVTRLGGPSTARTWSDGALLDTPLLDLDVYATSRQAANQTVASTRAAVGQLAGAIHDDTAILSVHETAGPTWRPDASQNITRLGFMAQLTVRPI